MFILLILIAAILLGLVRGGKLTHFADLGLRWHVIILLGFLIQVLIFSNFWQNNPDLKQYTPLGYVTSLVVLLVGLAVNYRIPGMPLLALGFLLNSIAIVANGGYMPASPDAFQLAGKSPLLPNQVNNNSIGMGPDTQLWFLGDIFAIPKGLPLPNIFSIGDVLIAIGAVYLIQKTMVRPSISPNKNLAEQ